MRHKRSKLARQLVIFRSAIGTTGSMIGVNHGKGRDRWWLLPLIVFLCVNGLILTLLAGAEALAPFVYAVF